MPAQFKTDKESVSIALAALLKKLASVSFTDIEAINDATWHAAAEFDVDQTTLEEALAASGWGVPEATAQAVLGNCTTTLPMRADFGHGQSEHRMLIGKTREGMSAAPNTIVERSLTDTIQRQERHIQFLTDELKRARADAPDMVLGQLRLRETILLHVGGNSDKLIAGLKSCLSDEAIRVVENYVFVLDNAPVSADVKAAIREAANHGMNRW